MMHHAVGKCVGKIPRPAMFDVVWSYSTPGVLVLKASISFWAAAILASMILLVCAAFKKFQIQPKNVSFTDCLVMAFADEFETKEIFGFDDSFQKNGYVRVGIDEK